MDAFEVSSELTRLILGADRLYRAGKAAGSDHLDREGLVPVHWSPLEPEHLDQSWCSFDFLLRRETLWLTVLPLRRVHDLLDSRHEHGVEVVGHLDQDEPAPPAVLAVEVDDGVACGAGASEEVNAPTAVLSCHPDKKLQKINRFGGAKNTRS